MGLVTGGNFTANRVSKEWDEDEEVALARRRDTDSELVFISWLLCKAAVKHLKCITHSVLTTMP